MKWGMVMRAFVIIHTFTIALTAYQCTDYNHKLHKTQSSYKLTNPSKTHAYNLQMNKGTWQIITLNSEDILHTLKDYLKHIYC